MPASNSMFAEIKVSGKPLTVERIVATIAVNELFQFRVHVIPRAAKAIAIADLLGNPAEITLTSPIDDTLHVKGIVQSVEQYSGHDTLGFQLVIAPEVVPLTVGKNHRLFQKSSVPDIVKKVLNVANIDPTLFEWHVGTHKPRDYVIQYGESDWEFIERILADEGINYAFLFAEDGTKCSFFDDSTNAPAVAGGSTLPFIDASSMLHEASVTNVVIESNVVTPKVRLRDYTPKNPPLKLDEPDAAGQGNLELYVHPGRFEEPSDGKARAKWLLDAIQRDRSLCQGNSNCLRMIPGQTFSLSGHPVPNASGPLFIVNAEISVRQGLAESKAGGREGFELSFTAVPKNNIWRPVPQEPKAMPGPQTAIVGGPSGQEIHTNDHGQVRAQFYWDREGKRDDKCSTWMRVGQLPLGGSMMLSRMQWDQLVAFGDGDGDAPVIVGHLYDGKKTVPYALPDNKTRTAWQTATTPHNGSANEIRFEDKAGEEEMFLNASKDMTIEVGHDSIEEVGVNHDTTIGVNQDINVGSNQSNTVTGSQAVSVGAMEALTVSGNRTIFVGGDDSETVGAARMVTVSKEASLDADGGRSLTAGAIMMSAAGMGVERATFGSENITVGGAWIAAAGTGIEASTAGSSSETVGGLKLQAAGGGLETNVKGTLNQNVGAALINVAGGSIGETSGGPLTIKVGAMMVITGPEVLIEAKSKISIQVGGASLTIESGKIEIKAPSLASPGATIAKTGSTVEHNS